MVPVGQGIRRGGASPGTGWLLATARERGGRGLATTRPQSRRDGSHAPRLERSEAPLRDWLPGTDRGWWQDPGSDLGRRGTDLHQDPALEGRASTHPPGEGGLPHRGRAPDEAPWTL